MDQNHDRMLYCSWVMVCDGCNCYFSFSAIFCPLTPLTAQKIKIKKKKKNEKHAWRNHHFTYVYQKLWSDDVQFLRCGVRRTDRWKKWHIKVGARPKNSTKTVTWKLVPSPLVFVKNYAQPLFENEIFEAMYLN